MMATFWAMLNGAPDIGSTLHYIVDPGIDTGPVVGRAPQPLDRLRTYLSNVLSLYPPGCRMVIAAVHGIDTGESTGRAEQPREARYSSTPEAADIARFEHAGFRLVDGSEFEAFIAQLPSELLWWVRPPGREWENYCRRAFSQGRNERQLNRGDNAH
jgi:methionyl-tRNA formyltransferase